ncbi:MAG: hypothetical protein HW421_1889 [Ignavibacteria bacterium]|nr:hypothetical protein [Ignavibacteria bacterium]
MTNPNTYLYKIINYFLILFFLFINYYITFAQHSVIESHTVDLNNISYFYEPFPQSVGSSILQLGGSFTILPIPLVENEYPVPTVDLQYKRGLYKNLSIDATFSTIALSNILHFGLQWNMNTGRFSYGVSNHIGGFYGFMTSEGQFDYNSAYAIFYMPILRFGYRFDNFSISTSWAATYLMKCVSKVSDLSAININNTWNDFFCTIAIEQPFLKQQHLSLGISMSYSRSPYQAWLLYNTIDNYLFAPEFFFAFQL